MDFVTVHILDKNTVMGHSMCLSDWATGMLRLLAKHYFWECLWKIFSIRISRLSKDPLTSANECHPIH